jgi:hypothetical protein
VQRHRATEHEEGGQEPDCQHDDRLTATDERDQDPEQEPGDAGDQVGPARVGVVEPEEGDGAEQEQEEGVDGVMFLHPDNPFDSTIGSWSRSGRVIIGRSATALKPARCEVSTRTATVVASTEN